ncbi:hypothetical protein A2U01_0071063, partial [Trifolium medium]|nr:hypothetical protein [Trifolium medium]
MKQQQYILPVRLAPDTRRLAPEPEQTAQTSSLWRLAPPPLRAAPRADQRI